MFHEKSIQVKKTRWQGTFAGMVAIVAMVLQFTTAEAARPKGEIGTDWGDPKGKECVECHWQETPGLNMQWNQSQHGQSGVNCLDCHKAGKGDIDAYEHEGQMIATIVSPKDCSACHETEFEEMDGSHHAHAGRILASLDNLLGEVVGGPEAVIVGCRQCHGAKVEIGEDGKPTGDTWPNTGIGRLNPDGSEGSCTACHGRHRFSKAQARTPDTCGKCHIGPDHPQLEVYNESKHGITYRAFVNEMNLDSDKWVAGIDYNAAPTCATCHMSRGGKEGKTHNVGDRISWNLRSPISKKINLVRLDNGQEYDIPGADAALPEIGSSPEKAKGAKVVEVLTWQDRRAKMQSVCTACHTDGVIKGHYSQMDNAIGLYNDKFAKPLAAIMGDLKKGGYITPTPFDDPIDWVWWEIWHHEGRVARHGAAMMGPDYAWWHGLYEVAKHTYFEFIPEMKEAVHKKDGNEEYAEVLLEKHLKPIPGHSWYFDGMSKEALDQVRKGFEERYGKGSMK